MYIRISTALHTGSKINLLPYSSTAGILKKFRKNPQNFGSQKLFLAKSQITF